MINLSLLFRKTDFFHSKNIVVATSGGSDSLALLLLCHKFLKKFNWQNRLIAVTIDHQLRNESRAEAEKVAQICSHYGIKHQIYSWNNPKPNSAISEKARLARYDLLAQAAWQNNAQLILLGHTLNDQIETYLMRQKRLKTKDIQTSRGIACMARTSFLYGSIILLRPLLSISRQDLQDYLSRQNIVWINDPTNENRHYERVRVRQKNNSNSWPSITDTITKVQQRRQNESHHIASLNQLINPIWSGEKLILTNLDDFWLNPYFSKYLAVLAHIIGGAIYLKFIDHRIFEQMLHAKKQTYLTKKTKKFSFGQSIIEFSYGKIQIWREDRNIKPIKLDAGQTAIWDNRYKIENKSDTLLNLRQPHLHELKSAINHLDKKNPSRIYRHYPSLLTSLAVEQNNKLLIPILNNSIDLPPCKDRVRIQTIIAPFYFISSQFDQEMVLEFTKLFALKLEIKNHYFN